MIISAEELLKRDKLNGEERFRGMNTDIISMKLEALENLIRSYTNNNFQNRSMRIEAPVVNGLLTGYSPYFREGDTIQISQSGVNDGLYVIKEIQSGEIHVDKELYDNPVNTITKVVYPPDIQKGVIDLMVWEKDNRKKVGIKSESLSRHSVTYFDQDSNNQVMGYPVSLLGFLKPYMRPRF